MQVGSNRKILSNVVMLYTRQILILLVSLVTVRIVLEVLGVTDYGIYSVVGGVVTLFSFLSATMASATQRFFSFSMGQGDKARLALNFSTNLLIYIVVAVAVLVVLETAGLWFVQTHLAVPHERFQAAVLLFHCSVLTFVPNIVTTPFKSIIIAHEDMHIHALVSILEVALKLLAVSILVFVNGDKLVLYGTLVLLSSFLIGLVFVVICIRKYPECRQFRFALDWALISETLNFTGWTFLGQLSTVFRNQAVTILINQFFSPVVVAARAISISFNQQVAVFSANFNTGLYPQIIKTYASGDIRRMRSLVFNGSKITFFLTWIIALPLLIEMDQVLAIWLKTPPPDAVLFSRLGLIEVVINSISSPLMTAARAPGKVKRYELILASLQLSIFFLGWVILANGGRPESVYVVAIVVHSIMFFLRILLVRKIIEAPVREFLAQVGLRILGVALVSSGLALGVKALLAPGFLSLLVEVACSLLFCAGAMYVLGLDEAWRKKVNAVVAKLARRLWALVPF